MQQLGNMKDKKDELSEPEHFACTVSKTCWEQHLSTLAENIEQIQLICAQQRKIKMTHMK